MAAVRGLSFLTPGNYPDDDPRAGLEGALDLFEFAEAQGYDGGWVRQRHLEHAVSSAAVFLAAASQRTTRLRLGVAVIPIGYEIPFRLAEDLTTADVLSGGRLQPGFSTGMPHADLLGDLVYDGDWRDYDMSRQRIARVIDFLASEPIGPDGTTVISPGGPQTPRLQPRSTGLADRLWYGVSGQASARWAGEHGLGLLTGNIVAGEGTDDFTEAQLRLIAIHRAATVGRPARIAVGRVIVPLDSADPSTRRRYREYRAGRLARTLSPQGPKRTLFAPDLVGTSEEIVATLLADRAIAEADELRLELPYEFTPADYQQILHDAATGIAPQLGWQPAVAAV